MPRFLEDENGNRFYQREDGSVVPSPRGAGIIEQAGRQVADIGSGVKYAAGVITGDEAMQAEAEAETQKRSDIFAGADYESPWLSMAGQAVPAAATFPISAPTFVGRAAIGAGIGALESALDIGEPGSAGQRASAGALGGAVGEGVGTVAGRVLNGIMGLGDALAGIRLRGNPEAEAFEALGGETLAYQRMNPGLGQRFAERFSQGAEVGMFPSARQGAVRASNDTLYKDTVAEAVGLDGSLYKDLGQDFVNDALTRLESGFEDVAEAARSTGNMNLTEQTAEALKSANQVRKLRQLGDFKGLDARTLTGSEWVTARQALAEDAANAFKNGDGVLGARYLKMVDELDGLMTNRLPEEFLPEFARLREQYRVMNILERPNVIGANNHINPRTLNRALSSKSQGFGRTFTRGQSATNPETDRLLALAEAGDKPQFKAHKSSGTAENLQTDIFMDQMTDAAQGLGQGDPTQAAGFLMRNAIGPVFDKAAEAGGGLPYDYLFNRPPLPGAVNVGAGAGRGLLDQMFYPFVGAQDERTQ